MAGPSTETLTERLEFCKTLNVRFNSAGVHRNLLIAACKYVEVVDDATHKYLMKLERKFGKDVLSGKWNNLNKVAQVCGREIELANKKWDG